MSFEEFGDIVEKVIEGLPEEWKRYLDNVTVDVEEEADAKLCRELDLPAGECPYGLFMPLRLPSSWSSDAFHTDDIPHHIVIFKRPLEEDFPDTPQLMIEIRKTVIHELAHHFGYSDRDLEPFDDDPNPFGDEKEAP